MVRNSSLRLDEGWQYLSGQYSTHSCFPWLRSWHGCSLTAVSLNLRLWGQTTAWGRVWRHLFGCPVGCNVTCGPQESQPAKVNDRPDNEQKASSRKGLSSVAVIELVPISIQPHHIIPLFLCSQIALVHSGCSSLVCCWGHFNLIHFINASQYFFIPYPEQRLRMCVPVFPGDLTARGRPPRSLWRVKKRAATWRQCADTPGPPQTAA